MSDYAAAAERIAPAARVAAVIVTVSTVKDTLAHVQRFVAGNLAGGVDHMFVFLDADQPGVRAWLEAHPHVTCVRAHDEGWWESDRPAELNVRQRINANVVKALLTRVERAEWVFHIDADEIAQIDRAALAAAPKDARAARLSPLEAVSRKSWGGEPTWFKRLLDEPDLTLLHVLGVIDRPQNGAYFHGHVDGKTGVRPTLDLWLTLHKVVDAERTEQEPWTHPGLNVLHYESVDGEEFVRKWTAILAAGPKVNFRPGREPTAVALQALLSKGLSQEQAAPYLMRIFERTTEDDFDTLRELGLLVEVDPREGTHTPEPLSQEEREHLDAMLEKVRAEPKRQFHPGRPAADVARTLDRVDRVDRVRARRSFLRRS